MLFFAVMFVRFVEELLNDVHKSHDPSWAECLDRTDVRDASLEQLRVADPGAPNRVMPTCERDGNPTALTCALQA